MMIWGGLLYLRQFDLPARRSPCRARDRLVRELRRGVRPCAFRYIPSRQGGSSSLLTAAGLGVYWLLSACCWRIPAYERRFKEQSLIIHESHRGAFRFEEACPQRFGRPLCLVVDHLARPPQRHRA